MWQVQSLEGGMLNSEQHLAWSNTWPADGVLRTIPSLIESQHFRSVMRYSLGIVRCRREGAGVLCALPEGTIALAFLDDTTRIEQHRIECRWRIAPGLLARRAETAIDGSSGLLTVGVERWPDGQNHAWTRVVDFPSVFLTPLQPSVRWLGAPWSLVGNLYGAFHTQASYSCLKGIARTLPCSGRPNI
jgi:hypothetical protein